MRDQRVPLMYRCRGFSLIETMMVLVIAVILAVVAVPGISDFLQARQASTVINHLSRAIYLTRTTAIDQSGYVTLCRSGDGDSCSGDWHDGYVVFEDSNRNAQVDEDEKVLLYQQALESGSQIKWRVFGNKKYLRMTPQGYTDDTNGTFIYCPPSHDVRFARGLTVNRAGRVYVREDSDGDGVVEYKGSNVECPQ